MSRKNLVVYSLLLVLTSSCSSNKSDSNNSPNLPAVNPGSPSGQVYVRAKAEFDLSSAPDGSAQFNLVKKTYAAAPNCLHGQCTDYSDITVTNEGSTQFQLAQSQAQINQSTSNQNLSNIVDLKIATLFDKNVNQQLFVFILLIQQGFKVQDFGVRPSGNRFLSPFLVVLLIPS
jgi:hypothetical protein